MTDMLKCVRRYLPSFEPFVTEDDVTIRELPLMRFRIAVDNNVEALWNDEDYDLAESYYQRLRAGEIAPAIVVNGSNILDGYHRLWAYFKWHREGGPNTIPGVDLGELFAIVDAIYDDAPT